MTFILGPAALESRSMPKDFSEKAEKVEAKIEKNNALLGSVLFWYY